MTFIQHSLHNFKTPENRQFGVYVYVRTYLLLKLYGVLQQKLCFFALVVVCSLFSLNNVCGRFLSTHICVCVRVCVRCCSFFRSLDLLLRPKQQREKGNIVCIWRRRRRKENVETISNKLFFINVIYKNVCSCVVYGCMPFSNIMTNNDLVISLKQTHKNKIRRKEHRNAHNSNSEINISWCLISK